MPVATNDNYICEAVGVCVGCKTSFSYTFKRQYCTTKCRRSHRADRTVENQNRLAFRNTLKEQYKASTYVVGSYYNERTCILCNAVFPNYRSDMIVCSKRCSTQLTKVYPSRYVQRKAGKERRRARMHNSPTVSYFNPIDILERDGWRCYICGCDTPQSLRGTHEDNAPELEHIIALANGGEHTPDNTACACRRCNRLKGANDNSPLSTIAA